MITDRTDEFGRLAEAIASAGDLHDLFRAVFAFAHETTPADGIFVALYEPAEGLRSCVYAANYVAGRGDRLELEESDPAIFPRHPLNDSPQSRAIVTNRVIDTPDLDAALAGLPRIDVGSDFDERPPRSSLAVPLRVEQETIGAFEVQSTRPAAFGAHHVSYLRMAASLAAIATRNLKLLDQERRQRGRYETLLEQSAVGIVILTADGRIERGNSRIEELTGYSVDSFRGRPLQDVGLLPPSEIDLERFERMPTGRTFLEQRSLRRRDGTLFDAEISARKLSDGRVQVIVQDVSDRVRYLREIEASREATFRALGLALEYRDQETKGHTDRVVALSTRFAGAVGLDADQVQALQWSAYLHDVGKIAIPDAILLKPGRLADDEYALIKRHTLIGADMCRDLAFLPVETLEVVRHHHERWDGSGYPDGLAGAAIPLLARMFAIVDLYDALVSERPYKPAWTHQAAIHEIREQAGRQLDPELVATFERVVDADAEPAGG